MQRKARSLIFKVVDREVVSKERVTKDVQTKFQGLQTQNTEFLALIFELY